MDINELYNTQKARQLNKTNFFKKILQKCYNRIKTVAEKSETFCFYLVPEFSIGIPLYNVYQCSEFIIDNLKKSGFNILYVRPNLIYISWDLRHYLNPSQISNIYTAVPQIESSEQIKNRVTNSLLNSSNNTISNISNINNNNINSDNKNIINTNQPRSTKDYKPNGRIIL